MLRAAVRRRPHQVRPPSRPITRACRRVLRLSIAMARFGLALLTGRSCAAVQVREVPVLKFYTAITSCMCWGTTHNGTGGATGGHPSEILILVVAEVPRLLYS